MWFCVTLMKPLGKIEVQNNIKEFLQSKIVGISSKWYMLNIYFLYVWMLVCVHVYIQNLWMVPVETEDLPSCELLCGCWERKSGPLQEWQVLLIAGLSTSPAPQNRYFKWTHQERILVVWVYLCRIHFSTFLVVMN